MRIFCKAVTGLYVVLCIAALAIIPLNVAGRGLHGAQRADPVDPVQLACSQNLFAAQRLGLAVGPSIALTSVAEPQRMAILAASQRRHA